MNKPPTWTIHQGDALTVLRTLPSESVHCVVTSPPYWGLRDYGTATWTDGDSNCDHLEAQGGSGEASAKQNTSAGSQVMQYKYKCGKCGATREDDQIGLEPTPGEYVTKMVGIFTEVKRVLRKDGTLWLNLGDSYGTGPGRNDTNRAGVDGFTGSQGKYGTQQIAKTSVAIATGSKPKDLVGIPWMVAFALRADGWYLRSDIIWSKPNPMPESVTDRPTKSHEYLFLLTKSERYYFDQEAVREPPAPSTLTRVVRDIREGNAPSNGDYKAGQGRGASRGQHADHLVLGNSEGRNIRSVWTIPTKPFPEAHFATFPPELVRTCLLAGISERGVCSNCGSPMVRIVEKIKPPLRSVVSEVAPGQAAHGLLGVARFDEPIQVKTIGWEPSCKCDAPTVPATVLDPFSGSGTTGVVATRMGYNYIGIELNPEYIAMSERRLESVSQQHGVFV